MISGPEGLKYQSLLVVSSGRKHDYEFSGNVVHSVTLIRVATRLVWQHRPQRLKEPQKVVHLLYTLGILDTVPKSH
jgi:hypothetical protein